MKVEIKEAILKIINSHPGIKNTELAIRLMEDMESRNDMEVLDRELSKLIQEGSIVEVEYILPSMDYRIKSLYFPKGTQVTVKTTEVKDSRWS